MPVNVTDTAAREIESIIKQQNLDAEKIHLRVGVKGGGCSGFSYLLDRSKKRGKNVQCIVLLFVKKDKRTINFTFFGGEQCTIYSIFCWQKECTINCTCVWTKTKHVQLIVHFFVKKQKRTFNCT